MNESTGNSTTISRYEMKCINTSVCTFSSLYFIEINALVSIHICSRLVIMNQLCILLVLVVVAVVYVDCHGRLWEPPGRGTEHRRVDQGYNVYWEDKDYNDNELFCGGKDVS